MYSEYGSTSGQRPTIDVNKLPFYLIIIIVIIIMMMMVMMMMIIIIMIMIIITALRGAIQDFFFNNLLTAPRTVSNTYAQVAWEQLSANHVQHIDSLSCASCSVPLGTKGQSL